jgi:NADH-quinone oxidoreductase B subunit
MNEEKSGMKAKWQPWQKVLAQVGTWARINSPWVIHFNSGSCNGCDIEILATLTPRYDLERFGIKLRGSPRHADILLCTGPVSVQARDRLLRIYEQMPEPKFVVAIGSCALSGGAFRGCYNVMDGVDQVIPVDAYIPGCPPRPEAIIDGIVKLLSSLQGGDPPQMPVLIEQEVLLMEGQTDGNSR